MAERASLRVALTEAVGESLPSRARRGRPSDSKEKLLAFLSGRQWATTSECAEYLGLTRGGLHPNMRALLESGDIERISHGLYRATAKARNG